MPGNNLWPFIFRKDQLEMFLYIRKYGLLVPFHLPFVSGNQLRSSSVTILQNIQYQNVSPIFLTKKKESLVSRSAVAGLQERSLNHVRQHSWIESKQEERTYFINAPWNVGQIIYSKLLQFRRQAMRIDTSTMERRSVGLKVQSRGFVPSLYHYFWCGSIWKPKDGSYNFQQQWNASCQIG